MHKLHRNYRWENWDWDPHMLKEKKLSMISLKINPEPDRNPKWNSKTSAALTHLASRWLPAALDAPGTREELPPPPPPPTPSHWIGLEGSMGTGIHIQVLQTIVTCCKVEGPPSSPQLSLPPSLSPSETLTDNHSTPNVCRCFVKHFGF